MSLRSALMLECERRRRSKKTRRRSEVAYLDRIPAAILPGMVVVHNSVRPSRRLGTRGFRAWLEPADAPNHEVCPCDWATELPEHYRVEVGILSAKPHRPFG
jgi:hypothetical protein